MKSWIRIVPMAALAVLLLGCEGDWTTGGGVESWSDAYNAVNFSGVYRAPANGILVTDYTSTDTSYPDSPGNFYPGGTNATQTIVNEEIARTAEGQTVFGGQLEHAPVVKGSLTIVSDHGATFQDNGSGALIASEGTSDRFDDVLIATGNGNTVTWGGTFPNAPVIAGSVSIIMKNVQQNKSYHFSDNGAGGLVNEDGLAGASGSINYSTAAWSILVPIIGQQSERVDVTASYRVGWAGDSSGTIAYDSGGWTLNFGGVPPGAGTKLFASYSYSASATNDSHGGAEPGTSGPTVYALTVFHEGQHLVITDNNGKQYEGSLGSIRTSGGQNATTDNAGTLVGTVVAQFTAEGTSAANVWVKMVGTLQGEAADNVLSARRIIGTWIEESTGVTGDINGEASPVDLPVVEEQQEAATP